MTFKMARREEIEKRQWALRVLAGRTVESWGISFCFESFCEELYISRFQDGKKTDILMLPKKDGNWCVVDGLALPWLFRLAFYNWPFFWLGTMSAFSKYKVYTKNGYIFFLSHHDQRHPPPPLILTQPMDPEKKLNFIFPTKYVIPKSLKFSHWPSKNHLNNTISFRIVTFDGWSQWQTAFQWPRCGFAESEHWRLGGTVAAPGDWTKREGPYATRTSSTSAMGSTMASRRRPRPATARPRARPAAARPSARPSPGGARPNARPSPWGARPNARPSPGGARPMARPTTTDRTRRQWLANLSWAMQVVPWKRPWWTMPSPQVWSPQPQLLVAQALALKVDLVRLLS